MRNMVQKGKRALKDEKRFNKVLLFVTVILTLGIICVVIIDYWVQQP